MSRFAWLSLVVLVGCREKPQAPLRVAAASDLIDVFTVLGQRFETQTKVKVEFAFGSSGLLSKQLSEGAPFDVFAAASASAVDEAVKAGACDGASARQFARGRLVLWPQRAALSTLSGLKGRIALANPEHAPYGRAAKEALEKAGLWAEVESRVVYAENVRQALQFVETGNAESGLVAWSNVVGREGGATGVLVDASLHTPLEQVVATCRRGARASEASSFIEFLQRPESRAEFTKRGFELP